MNGTPSCSLNDAMAVYVCCAGPMILRDRMLQMMPNVALAIHLLNERYNPSSFWKPYIGKKHVYNVVDDVYFHIHLYMKEGPSCLPSSVFLLYFPSNFILVLLSPHYQRFSHTASLFPCPSVGPTWSCCKALPASVSGLCFFQACDLEAISHMCMWMLRRLYCMCTNMQSPS